MRSLSLSTYQLNRSKFSVANEHGPRWQQEPQDSRSCCERPVLVLQSDASPRAPVQTVSGRWGRPKRGARVPSYWQPYGKVTRVCRPDILSKRPCDLPSSREAPACRLRVGLTTSTENLAAPSPIADVANAATLPAVGNSPTNAGTHARRGPVIREMRTACGFMRWLSTPSTCMAGSCGIPGAHASARIPSPSHPIRSTHPVLRRHDMALSYLQFGSI